MKNKPTQSGFTLAELLIALAILGVIATFTIPKILDSGGNAQANAQFKEMVATLSGSLQAHKLAGLLASGTGGVDLTQYMNFTRVITVNTVSVGPLSCNNTAQCLSLHNGGILRPHFETFNATSSTNCIRFLYDPDESGALDSVEIYLYYNGRITDVDNKLANTCSSAGCPPPSLETTPNWLSWSN